jgi:hypothetical protein
MNKINVEETYNNIKEDISKDYKSYILTPKKFLDKYRGDRINNVFVGYIEESTPEYEYIITIYVRGFRSVDSISSTIYLNSKYKQVREDVKRRPIK